MLERIDLPPSLKPFYFTFHWSQEKLWKLNLESEKRKVSDFMWLLKYPIWASNPPDKIFDLKPQIVLDNLDQYPIHRKRIEKASLDFPIHIMFWKNSWVIMDGFHRLLKCLLYGYEEILVKIVSPDQIADIQPDLGNLKGFAKIERDKGEKDLSR